MLQNFLDPNTNPFTRTAAPEIPLSNDVSELPDSFEDAVKRSGLRTLECIATGSKKCRIDFDTSVGDITFTSLKNTLPMVKELVKVLCSEMQLVGPAAENKVWINPARPVSRAAAAAAKSAPSVVSTKEKTQEQIDKEEDEREAAEIAAAEGLGMQALPQQQGPLKTLRIFFPDMGAAALVRRDWKMGTDVPDVPTAVFTANIQNDPLADTDKLAILLCPLFSEADFAKRVIDLCAEKGIPLIMINPELINMDQGFGVRARNMRSQVLSQFVTTYKLKTMKQGALVREWPRGFSVWNEDTTQESGYSLLQTYARDPTREMVDELFDIANPEDPNANKEPSAASLILNEVTGFFKVTPRSNEHFSSSSYFALSFY